jgi:hypothetical protein
MKTRIMRQGNMKWTFKQDKLGYWKANFSPTPYNCQKIRVHEIGYSKCKLKPFHKGKCEFA